MNELEMSAFADRVMTTIEAIHAPTAARAFGSSLRARAWRDAMASLLVAWHLGTVRTWSVAPRVRVRSIALVLAVASVLATGSIVAAAAVRVAVPDARRLPPVTTPATQPSSAPIVDGPGLDDSDQDLVRVPPAPAAQPGAAKTEPTAGASGAHGSEPRNPADHPSATPRPGSDAGANQDGTKSLDDSDDGGGHSGDTGGHDGSGDSGGGGSAEGGDSSGGGDN